MRMSEKKSQAPKITVLQVDDYVPSGRLGVWLFSEGASLQTVRIYAGEPVPALAEVGAGLVLLGGRMSAHDDAEHPWLEPVRQLLRDAVEQNLPVIASCLGAQVAAEALGGITELALPGGSEEGMVPLHLHENAAEDKIFGEIVDEAVRAAVRAGISTQDGTQFPVPCSHADCVVELPAQAIALGRTDAVVIHSWRVGRLLALQHHPEVAPEDLGTWAQNTLLRGGATQTQAQAEGQRVRAEALAADAITQAFGRALARVMVRLAQAYQKTA